MKRFKLVLILMVFSISLMAQSNNTKRIDSIQNVSVEKVKQVSETELKMESWMVSRKTWRTHRRNERKDYRNHKRKRKNHRRK